MNRRKFGMMAGSSLTAAAIVRPAAAQSADPSLLTTTLTPFGAERAGNADGSIPAWTGGNVAPPTTPDQTIDVPFAVDEHQLYVVDAANLSQYQNIVTPGVQAMISKFGFSLQVYPTHRTAAAPQYVYDNMAKNVTRAKLDPAGGRFGFTGAYGGLPFPIIDTSDPDTAGIQIIWNHLTHWEGFSNHTTFSPAIIISDGRLVLAGAPFSRFLYPYYDPDGSPETFSGYYSKLHTYEKAPAALIGEETLIWHTTNINVKPDIVWQLLNGQGRVRKAPDEAYDTPNPSYNGIANIDESQGFYGNPSKYDWKLISKSEMLVPYNCNKFHNHEATELMLPKFPNPDLIRWEKHRVWVVEATLHPGERNVIPRRRFYMDEDTGQIVLGESYDADNNMLRVYFNPTRTIPSVPMVNPAFILIFSVVTGDYVMNGNANFPGHPSDEYTDPESSGYFDATQMAAGASF